MFTKKDRRIANPEVKRKNRDTLIEYYKDKTEKLEAVINEVKDLTEENNYNRPEIYLKRIKELVRPLNQN